MKKEEIKQHYSTVYITLISILLGIALGDLIGVFRSISSPTYFEWLSLLYIVLIIMNTWIAYSLHSISIKAIPTPADAINVFTISIAHFVLNSFLGKEHYLIYCAVAFYSIVSIFTFAYLAKRSFNQPEDKYKVKKFRKLIAFNSIGVIVTLVIAYLSYQQFLSKMAEIIIFGLGYFFVIMWLYLYWNTWKKLLED